MLFSKSEMQKELLEFLALFGKDIASLYGIEGHELTESETIQESPAWKAVSEMYDYGVMGRPTGDLVPGNIINGRHAQIETFLRAMDTPPMRIYLEESDNTPPRLAIRAVQSAVARMVLDGGDRYTDFEAGDYEVIEADAHYLTIAEMALLANMDERSVRNATNPKLPDPLKTEKIGKRSLVNREEGRRWLASRKGFVPTQESEFDAVQAPPSWDLVLPEEFAEHIQRAAKKAGVSVNSYLKQKLIKAFEGEQK